MRPAPHQAGLSTRRPVLWGSLAILALACALAAWASGAPIATGMTLGGQIAAAQPRQIVQHPEGGRVARLHIAEGEPVIAGQVLVSLDPEPLGSEMSVIEARLFALHAQRLRLEAEANDLESIAIPPALARRAGTDAMLAAALTQQARLHEERHRRAAQDMARHRLRQAQVEARIAGLLAQVAALEEQRALIAREQTRQQELRARGLVAEAPVLALRRDAARTDGDLAEARATIAQSRDTLVEIDIAIAGAQTARREAALSALRDLAPPEAELEERRRALELRLEGLQIRAPLSGTVHALRVSGPGAVIRPADPLLWIVPEDRPPIVELRIPPGDIDAVHQGQLARISLPALGRRDAPDLAGTLERISADPFEEEGKGAFYRAEIRLEDGSVANLPEGVRLIPGMPVEVHLSTGTRRPLEALAGPLGSYFTRAFANG